QEAVQKPIADKPKDSPDRVAEKIKDKEQLETVQREDKIQNIDHPAGHRVLEHGNAENRSDLASAQAEAGGGFAPIVDTDKVVPPWIAVLFQEQQEQQKLKNKGKSGGHKQSNEIMEYRLSDLLFILLTATVCGCRSIADYINFIQSREKWLKVILGAQFNLPPKELVWRILSSLNPVNFQNFLSPWLEEICGHPSRLKNQEGKPVLPAISIWQSPIGLMMGQAKGSDPYQDRLAIPILLQLFNLRSGVVVSKSASHKIDLPALIEKVKTDFLVEIHDDSNAADEIVALIEAAAKKESHLYRIEESYIEGQDRMVVESLQIDKSYRLPSYPTHAPATQILKVYDETVTSGTITIKSSYFLSNLNSVDSEIFNLLRLQKPLDRKVAWHLNCLFPILPMAFALQQCQQNILLIRQFAIGLLQKSGGVLTLDEKMHLAASSNEELLKLLR
ncbi:MAG TPA: transposase family protein, partial [Parachlamydiaceae bacterium]|nr:transposase family protein [Parachlamydiaceae bacterium]